MYSIVRGGIKKFYTFSNLYGDNVTDLWADVPLRKLHSGTVDYDNVTYPWEDVPLGNGNVGYSRILYDADAFFNKPITGPDQFFTLMQLFTHTLYSASPHPSHIVTPLPVPMLISLPMF